MRFLFLGNLGSAELILLLIVFAIFLIPYYLYLVTLEKTLENIKPENQFIKPTKIFYLFIPYFNFYWNFVVVNRLTKSLSKEFESRQINLEPSELGKDLGTGYSIFLILSFFPEIGPFSALIALVLWVLYWMKISKLKNKLKRNLV